VIASPPARHRSTARFRGDITSQYLMYRDLNSNFRSLFRRPRRSSHVHGTTASDPPYYYQAVSRQNHQPVSARHHVKRSLITCLVPDVNSHPTSVIPSQLTDCRSTARSHSSIFRKYPMRCDPINSTLQPREQPPSL